MKKKLLFLVILFSVFIGNAQPPTVGMLYHDANVSEGFTLFSPLRNNEVFLINPCGEKVNQWTFTEVPGATCYLLNNGNLLRAGRDNLQIRDWNNNIVWSYPTTANGILQHHDITPLPNGNVLCIVSDSYTLAEMTTAGRNPAITSASFKLEKIIEIQPIGANSAAIVWEWKFKDHLVQDFDATKSNYGVVQNRPELLDINYANGSLTDYLHCNGIDYNASRDEIIISARHLNEIYIIDHSTTTAQAASHSGGNSNKGGDFLWRWGNPQVYRQGTEANRKLFLQHNPMWVENGYLDAGKISVFSNGEANSAQQVSSVLLVNPEISNNAYTMTNAIFNPPTYDWFWSGSILGVVFLQDRQSGTQSLPNGNIIISEALLGRVSEITKTGTLLWSYKNPTGIYTNPTTVYYPQFTTIPANVNGVFKAEKYPPNFPGFVGHSMTPMGTIENTNSLSIACSSLGTSDFNSQNLFVLEPVKNNLIQFSTTINADNISIFDTNGRKVFSENSFSGNEINVTLNPSLYILKIQSETAEKTIKLLIQ